jgi:hypothetical protein
MRTAEVGRTAIKCWRCGRRNLAIDSWCARCAAYLDDPTLGYRRSYRLPRPGRLLPVRVRLRLLLVVVALALLALQSPRSVTAVASVRALGGAVVNRLSQVEARLADLRLLWSPSLETVPPPAVRAPATRQSAAEGGQAAASPPPDSPPLVEAPPSPAPQAVQPPSGDSAPASGEAVGGTGADSPAGAVALFYQRVAAHDFDAAGDLWTDRMREQYPTDTYIDQRFANTRSIELLQDRLVGVGETTASVAVALLEVDAGQTRRWVGTWRVVLTPGGWLLDQPAFWCCW